VARWLTQQVAEYDVTNDFWKFQTAEISSLFNAFSALVTLPSHDLVVIGGLDDSVPNRPAFANSCFMIQEVPEDAYTNRYIEKHLPSMITRRGCMAAVYHEGYIYCFGGINYTDKVMRKCERFSFFDDTPKWEKIADMKQCRKNASAVSVTADTIYVFGGSTNSQPTLDSIEQYSVASNRWNTLQVKMPISLCFLSSFKLSSTKILILGGTTTQQSTESRQP